MVIVAPSADDRELLISRLAVRLGFAKVPSDAKKIIRKDIYSVDLATAYFVLSCRHLFFFIYYIKNQIFTHCTIFVQKRTIRTKRHKNAFCTQNNDFVPKSTSFCTGLTN